MCDFLSNMINACVQTTVRRYIKKKEEKEKNLIKIDLQVIQQDD